MPARSTSSRRRPRRRASGTAAVALVAGVVAGVTGVAPPATADCTSSVHYRAAPRGGVVPERRVHCGATADERRADADARRARIAACEAAGFAADCARLAALHDAAVARQRDRNTARRAHRSGRAAAPRASGSE